MNLRLGYRLQLAEASWPKTVRTEGSFRLATQWRNAGVAPCYPGGYPALTLKDAKGGIAGVFVDGGFDVRTLPVGPPGQAEIRAHEAEFTLPFNLGSGTYEAYLSVGTRTGTPRIALPLADSDGQRRYRLGTLTVTGDYDVRVGELAKREGEFVLPVTWTVHTPLPAGVSPFCHFERDGAIAFQGGPAKERPVKDLEQPGTIDLPLVFSVPEAARGKTFDVKIGLWIPERIGRADERLIPDRDAGDRRILVGRLVVNAAGEAALE
jgi:hypothetical protein